MSQTVRWTITKSFPTYYYNTKRLAHVQDKVLRPMVQASCGPLLEAEMLYQAKLDAGVNNREAPQDS